MSYNGIGLATRFWKSKTLTGYCPAPGKGRMFVRLQSMDAGLTLEQALHYDQKIISEFRSQVPIALAIYNRDDDDATDDEFVIV